MLSSKNIFYTILYITVGFSMLYGVFFSINKKRMLEEIPITTEAIIIKKYSIISRDYYVNYEFYVDNKKYKGSQKLKKKDLIIKEGDKFLVEYAEKNPSYNKIDLNKKIEK